VKLRRLRIGELVALVGAALVVAALTQGQYRTPSGDIDAWSAFGVGVALLIVATALALLLVVATLTERSPAFPIASAVWSSAVAIVAVIAAIVRVLERPDHATGPALGAWLALAGACAILAGSWQAMRDERTSAYPPPDVQRRPAPAATTATEA
jgi:Na+-transporting NADH:ubiquinone oxidoreductase subunit NqrE